MLVLWALSATAWADEVRGVTVSCPTWGWEWGSDAMVQTLDELDALGAGWVAIHPYARIRGDGTVAYEGMDPNDPPEWIARPIREAHARGLKVMVKPHLAYWGSPFPWRGAIRFDDPVQRSWFFTSYTGWITQLAAASKGADAFVVGTELDGMVAHEAEWRRVILGVRGAYDGPITYAANWDSYQTVGFWDAVDVVGIQAYFPVSADAGPVDRAVLDAGWEKVMGELRAHSAKTGKHVVFTELGYPRSADAAHKPWEATDRSEHADYQALCLDAALDAIEREPVVIGSFLWKWFPGDRVPRDFPLQRPEPRQVLTEHWTAP